MNVLWITNVELPAVAREKNHNIVICGWLEVMAAQLTKMPDINLYVASSTDYSTYLDEVIDGTHYYAFNEPNSDGILDRALADAKPDVIHMWGTEMWHCKVFTNLVQQAGYLDRFVVSIQGLTHIYDKHFIVDIPSKVVNGRTLKEHYRRPNIADFHQIMHEHGLEEIEILKMIKYCIGRTRWDYDAVKAVNPSVTYFTGEESLREQFYRGEWTYEACNEHTIFYSQAHYPVKGFHIFLKALARLKQSYEDVKVKVLGADPFSKKGLNALIDASSYESYIKKLIIRYNLRDNIEFLGKLDADAMLRQYKLANVFVCASTIENSSNSVCEAMLVGTPVVASRVGGMESIIDHGISGLIYDLEDTEAMVGHIEKLFEDESLCRELSNNAKEVAMKRHDKENNFSRLLEIYNTIM